MNHGFAFVDEQVPGLRWDAKYATWDNFTGRPVDGYLANRIVGTTALCDALRRAQVEAALLGFGLLIWDGYRPQRATDSFVRWSEQPEDGARKQRFYPNIDRAEIFEKGYVDIKSGHSRGSTVDLTLFSSQTGEMVQMGGAHDLMDESSRHDATGISSAERVARRSLREIMERSGFAAYETEWWHYTLTGEPYPDTYFDFPVGNG